MKYNFDEIIERRHTNALNTDGFRGYIFHAGPEKVFPFKDEEFIRMWVADMEFATPPEICQAMKDRIDKRIFGYSGVYNSEYYDIFSKWCKDMYDFEFPQEQLKFSAGIIPALYQFVEDFCLPDKKMLTLAPAYGYFLHAAEYNGIELVASNLKNDNGYFTIDFDDLEAKAKDPDVAMLMWCNPHNPTGRVWTEDELKRVAEIVKKYDLWIVSDEIHCDLLRCGMTFHPILKVAPDYADRIAVCTAPSKTFNLAGMKTSNIVIHNKELQAAWKELIGGKLSMNGAGTLGLTAMIAAYNEGEEWLEQLKEYLDGNFAYIDAFLKEHLPKAHMVPSEGTYLAWIDFNGYVDGDAEKLEEIMQKKARVALDEGYIFGDAGRGFERINIATPRSVVEDCMDRILKAFKEEKLV